MKTILPVQIRLCLLGVTLLLFFNGLSGQESSLVLELGHSKVAEITSFLKTENGHLLGGQFTDELFMSNDTLRSRGQTDVFLLRSEENRFTTFIQVGDTGREKLLSLSKSGDNLEFVMAFWDTTTVDGIRYIARDRSRNLLHCMIDEEGQYLFKKQISSAGDIVISDFFSAGENLRFGLVTESDLRIDDEVFVASAGNFYVLSTDESRQIPLYFSGVVRKIFTFLLDNDFQLVGEFKGSVYTETGDTINSISTWHDGFLYNETTEILSQIKSLYDVEMVSSQSTDEGMNFLVYFTSYLETAEFTISGKNDARTYATFVWNGITSRSPQKLGYHDYDIVSRSVQTENIAANYLYERQSLYQTSADSIIIWSPDLMHLDKLISDFSSDYMLLERKDDVIFGEKRWTFDHEQSWVIMHLPKDYTATVIQEDVSLHLFPNPTSGKIHLETTDYENYQVISITGQVLDSGKCREKIDIGALEDGLYMFIFTSPSKKPTKRKIFLLH